MAKPSASQKIPTVLIYMLFSINKNPNPSPIGEKFGLVGFGGQRHEIHEHDEGRKYWRLS